MNNQLECFFLFLFLFSSNIKYIYDIPKPKSQTPKDSKRITTFIKSTASHQYQNHKLPSLNRKTKSISLFIGYSYGLGLNV